MADPKKLLHKIKADMKVELSEMFDRNFEQKGFFGQRWKPRKDPNAKGSLLLVTAAMRRDVHAAVSARGVRFSSNLPRTKLHNEGGKFSQSVGAHTRLLKKTGQRYKVRAHIRNVNMPARRFVGNHPKVQTAVGDIVAQRTTEYFMNLAKELHK